MRTVINLLLWSMLIITAWHMAGLNTWLCQTKAISPLGLTSLTFSDEEHGKEILEQWKTYPNANLFLIAQKSLRTDFVFMFCYVALIWRLCYTQMLRDYRLWLNDMLRLNILLGVLTGLLDVWENVGMLHNISLYPVGYFWPTAVVAVVKYALGAWIILVYLFSIISLPLIKRRNKKSFVYT